MFVASAYEETINVLLNKYPLIGGDGYKIDVFASAWFKLFSHRLIYIFRLELLNLGYMV
ncbi:hypothetical protein A45J_1763 [hot springs metagenome]|uniref:Uncharacterized protein n=1 Tax=hot springs metagenome TaxID=433727 RepID=A0A5J4L1B6_9ZZZZ